jgi:hypothetical protein
MICASHGRRWEQHISVQSHKNSKESDRDEEQGGKGCHGLCRRGSASNAEICNVATAHYASDEEEHDHGNADTNQETHREGRAAENGCVVTEIWVCKGFERNVSYRYFGYRTTMVPPTPYAKRHSITCNGKARVDSYPRRMAATAHSIWFRTQITTKPYVLELAPAAPAMAQITKQKMSTKLAIQLYLHPCRHHKKAVHAEPQKTRPRTKSLYGWHPTTL